MADRLIRRFTLIAGVLGSTLALGTAGFRLIEGFSWFDAFYMTLTTITTVGYQEIHPLSHSGRVFNCFLILFGVTAMFLAVGGMTQTIIELELQDTYGKRRKRRMIENLNDHFIVCGFGRVGRNACEEFERIKAPFLVIDRNEQRVLRATNAGMLAMVADATQDESLRRAGVLKAKGLIAALPSDAENLFIILSAKALNPALIVVTRVTEEEAGEKLRRAGADTVLTPYTMAGRQLADALLRPHVVEFLDFARSNLGQEITMEEVCVSGNADSRRRTLGALVRSRTSGAIVLAVRQHRGDTIFNPSPDVEICPGDFLIVMGKRSSLKELEQLLTNQ
jgi:voltage-gated potassium channel